MLEGTDAITNEVLEQITFVLAYPTVCVCVCVYIYIYIYLPPGFYFNINQNNF